MGSVGIMIKEATWQSVCRRFGRQALMAAMGALAVPLTIGFVAVPPLRAQTNAPQSLEAMEAAGVKLSFEVASLKPNTSRDRPTSNQGGALDDAFAPTGGLFSMTNMPVTDLLRYAFKTIRIPVGLPDWANMDRYDVQARAQGNPTKDQYRLMLQSLLADRFKLTVHRETRQLPIYALVVAREGKLGPQLKADNEPCETTAADVQAIANTPRMPAASQSGNVRTPQIPCGTLLLVPASVPGRMRAAGIKVPIALLTRFLPNPASGLNRPVFDQTGLSGTFDMSIEFTPAVTLPLPDFTPDEAGPTFSEAIQDQLGLKLQPTTGPVDVLVIDHIERPSEN